MINIPYIERKQFLGVLVFYLGEVIHGLFKKPFKEMHHLRKYHIHYFVYNFRVLGFPTTITTTLNPIYGLLLEGNGVFIDLWPCFRDLKNLVKVGTLFPLTW